jgi:hypothetical protein
MKQMPAKIARRCSIIGLSLGALVLLWAPAPAQACSISLCSLGYAAPRGGIIPANAPALVYVAPPGIDDTPEGSLLLMTLDGQPLSFTSVPDPAGGQGQFLITPTPPLQPSASYRLVGIGQCPGGLNGDLNVPFDVGPPEPLPAAMPSVIVHPPETTDLDVPGGPACVAQHRVAGTFLEWSFPDLGNYGSLTQYILKVDGQPWGDSSYGMALNGINPAYPYAVCDEAYAGYGLRPGPHHGELSIHVAGAPSDPPPVSFEFNLDCKAPYVLAGAPNPSKSSGGCAVGGAPASDALTWLVGLCLLALARRRASARGGWRSPARTRRNGDAGVYSRA